MNTTRNEMTTTECTIALHEALKIDRARFRAVTHLIGYMPVASDCCLELRNHSCGSTLALELDAEAIEALTPPCAVETVEVLS